MAYKPKELSIYQLRQIQQESLMAKNFRLFHIALSYNSHYDLNSAKHKIKFNITYQCNTDIFKDSTCYLPDFTFNEKFHIIDGTFIHLLKLNHILPDVERFYCSRKKTDEPYGSNWIGRIKMYIYYHDISHEPYGIGYDLIRNVFVLWDQDKHYESKLFKRTKFTHDIDKINNRLMRFCRKTSKPNRINFSGNSFELSDGKKSDKITDIRWLL
jgi:hypothetical protein